MDLNEIVVFARVVQAGSFSAAARQLGMPKSTVSRKVAELEDRLDTRLLQRTTRKLRLTDAGRTYYDHSARIVAELEEADRAMSQIQSVPRGLLRVTAPLRFTSLGPVLVRALEKYPELELDLYCTDRTVDIIEEGFDLAIRAGPLGDSSLIARSLGTIRRVVVAAPDYCKQHGTPKVPADLAKHACLVFGAGTNPDLWVLHAGGKRAEVKVRARATINDFEILSEAARASLGIAWMPESSVAEDLDKGRLRRVLPNWSSAETPVHALYPSTRHLSPKVAAFLEVLRQIPIL
jgi:DNA-binding transcriptional LysR family regulator